MVDISHETPEQVNARLERVIKQCRLHIYDEPQAFEEFAIADFAEKANPQALALVRDDIVWSQLVQGKDGQAEQFAVWRFHFPAEADNSGFVGWLATRHKQRFGQAFSSSVAKTAPTGVFSTIGAVLGQ